jgi:hypothetical protein
VIEMKVPALAKDRLNEILDEMPEHKKYVMSTLTEHNAILKQLDKLDDEKVLIKAIQFFTADRERSIDESSRPETVKTHLKNLIQTISKIRIRNLKPIWFIVDEKLDRACKKTFSQKTTALNALKRMQRTDKNARVWVISCNEYQEILYLNKRDFNF